MQINQGMFAANINVLSSMGSMLNTTKWSDNLANGERQCAKKVYSRNQRSAEGGYPNGSGWFKTF